MQRAMVSCRRRERWSSSARTSTRATARHDAARMGVLEGIRPSKLRQGGHGSFDQAHSGVLVGKTAITLARLHGSQNQTAARRAHELVHQLLLHCGAACCQVHQMLGQGGFGKVLAVTRSDSGERFAMKAILKHGSPSAATNAKMVKQAQVERRILRRVYVHHRFALRLPDAR